MSALPDDPNFNKSISFGGGAVATTGVVAADVDGPPSSLPPFTSDAADARGTTAINFSLLDGINALLFDGLNEPLLAEVALSLIEVPASHLVVCIPHDADARSPPLLSSLAHGAN